MNQGEPSADVEINDGSVRVSLEMQFNIEFGDESVTARKHEVEVATNLGSLYNSAKEIYEKEQDELFLENYAVDTLRLYAPVDGVELTCAPLTWSADAVFDDLKEAIELNTLALRTSGGDYSLAKEENEYFVVDVGSDARFLNSRNWSNSFEVAPSQGSVLISEPVGNQPGLGALGFCYVPYHFVYNVRYPVLVQVFDGEEIFQFPIAIVINGNKPREALESEASEVESPNICEYKNTEISVKTYDTDLKLVDSEISFECFGETCDIGETSNGVLDEKFPQCVNGYVLARADGFDDARYLFSTVEEGTAEIILDRLYAENVELKIDGKSYSGDAIISFVSDDGSQTIVYPETKKIELKEGQYEVQVDVYENSELKFDESVSQQCVDVPKGGLGGLFGLTEEQCFDITIPAQVVSNALSGGGKQNYYILESELKNSNTIEIDAGSLPEPTSLEKLQDNYVLFEGKGLEVNFK